MRDEKQVLKNKREQERSEMRKALEAQIAEKKQHQEEEKKRRIQDDLRLERTMCQFYNPPAGETLGKQPDVEKTKTDNAPRSLANTMSAQKGPPLRLEELEAVENTPAPKHQRKASLTNRKVNSSSENVCAIEEQLDGAEDNPQEEPAAREAQIGAGDERWDLLKSQIQVYL